MANEPEASLEYKDGETKITAKGKNSHSLLLGIAVVLGVLILLVFFAKVNWTDIENFPTRTTFFVFGIVTILLIRGMGEFKKVSYRNIHFKVTGIV